MDFDWSVPVLVIGAGACGLSTALAASEAGAEVLVLEQDARPSGSTGMSYGAICAAATGLQQAEGINDEGQWLFEDIMAVTRGQTSERLARTLAENCGPAVDWLVARHGLELTVVTAWTGLGHRQPRLHAPHSRSGEHLMGMLLQAVQKAGTDVLTEARVTTLLVDDNDRVIGVRIQRPDGSVETLGCDSLVLATCGFGDNHEWVASHIPELADARYYGHEGNRGDGIAWGRELGAASADMGSFQALGSLAHPQSLVIPHTLLIGGGVQVNQFGERFEDELDDISGQALTILEQPGGFAGWFTTSACTSKRWRVSRNTVMRLKSIPPNGLMTGPAGGGSPAWRRETFGGDHASGAAVGWRNAATDEFGRQLQAGQTLKPPFYAIRVTGALFHTQGGLVVDENARVLVTPATAAQPVGRRWRRLFGIRPWWLGLSAGNGPVHRRYPGPPGGRRSRRAGAVGKPCRFR